MTHGVPPPSAKAPVNPRPNPAAADEDRPSRFSRLVSSHCCWAQPTAADHRHDVQTHRVAATRRASLSWLAGVGAGAAYFLALACFAASASSWARFLLPATQPSLRATPETLSSVHPSVRPAASFFPARPRLKPCALAASLSIGRGHSWSWAEDSAGTG